MTTGDRIKQARIAAGLTQTELADKIGVKFAAIHKYETGLIVNLKRDTIEKLASALNVRPTWLMCLDDDSTANLPGNIIPMPKMRRIPLLGTIACGTPITAAENYDGDVDIPDNIHADFALRCKGDSMINARIFDGDICYIRKQDTVENGQIAAVLIDDEATLKRVRIFDDHIILEPENPQYRPLVYWGEEMASVSILGLAVAFTSAVK